MFAFDLYDGDRSGIIESSEIKRMLQDIYGKDKFATNPYAKAIIAKLKSLSSDFLMNINEFRQFSDSYPALLFPAFEVQMKIQDNILGREFWMHCSHRNIPLGSGKFINIRDLMDLNVNGGQFKAITEVSHVVSMYIEC